MDQWFDTFVVLKHRSMVQDDQCIDKDSVTMCLKCLLHSTSFIIGYMSLSLFLGPAATRRIRWVQTRPGRPRQSGEERGTCYVCVFQCIRTPSIIGPSVFVVCAHLNHLLALGNVDVT